MQLLSYEEWERTATDKYKACVGCKYLSKDKGTVRRSKVEEEGKVYLCGLGQYELTKNVRELPEQCPARNLKEHLGEQQYKFKPAVKERNNCNICMVYQDQKPICKQEGMVVEYCPCKTCESFGATAYGCINYTEECKKKMKIKEISE